jgi:hypothetical protein
MENKIFKPETCRKSAIKFQLAKGRIIADAFRQVICSDIDIKSTRGTSSSPVDPGADRQSFPSDHTNFVFMSNTTPIPIQASSLREWVLSKSLPNSSSPSIPKAFQIVDVRDDDYVGGHIPGTLNIPSRQFLSRVNTLVDELKDKEAVVFTCALSQQRGPNVRLEG